LLFALCSLLFALCSSLFAALLPSGVAYTSAQEYDTTKRKVSPECSAIVAHALV
jgi:hypothetical protein